MIAKRSRCSLCLLLVIACGGSTRDDTPATAEGALGVQDASAKLEKELFSDRTQTVAKVYYLAGHRPGRSEKCEVMIRRRGLRPRQHTWSRIAVAPFGANSGQNKLAEISYATPREASDDREKIVIDGDVTTYTRTERDERRSQHVALTFSGAPHGYQKLTKVAFGGEDVNGPNNGACEGLSELIVIDENEIEAKATRDLKDWQRDNDDEESLEFQSCSVDKPTTVVCLFGNETNEETLVIEYKIENGAIGAIKNVSRESEWH